jgi:Flp pilus assembly protein TadB
MRASRPTRETVTAAEQTDDSSPSGIRRRWEPRRRHAAGVDVGLGLAAAVAAVALARGLAIVAVIALVVLAVCLISLVISRRRSRRLLGP